MISIKLFIVNCPTQCKRLYCIVFHVFVRRVVKLVGISYHR